jgi:hypothetical protein
MSARRWNHASTTGFVRCQKREHHVTGDPSADALDVIGTDGFTGTPS